MFNTFEDKMKNLRKVIPHKWKPQVSNQWKVIYVAYIDARAGMDLLDETFGINNWKVEFFHRDRNTILKLTEKVTELDKDKKEVTRERIVGTLPISETITVCRISIYDDEKKEWITKEDVGYHSDFAEIGRYGDKEDNDKEKADASDAFKRACVHFGIGRFLYDLESVEFPSKNYNGQWKPVDDCGNIIWEAEDLEYAIKQKQANNPKIDIKNKIKRPHQTPENQVQKTNNLEEKTIQKQTTIGTKNKEAKKTLTELLQAFKVMLIASPKIDIRLREILKDDKYEEQRVSFIKNFFGVSQIKDINVSMLENILDRLTNDDEKIIDTINQISKESIKC